MLLQWLAAMRVAQAHNQSVAQETALVNLERLRWAVRIIVPFNLACVAVFWWGIDAVEPQQMLWKQQVGAVHLAMALLLGVCGLACELVLRRGAAPVWANVLQVLAPGCGLVFAAMLAIVDQRVSPNISPFLLGSVFVGLVILVRPLRAVIVYLVGFAVLYVGLGLTQEDPFQLLSNRINGFFSVILGCMIAVLLWQKNAQYILLNRELQQRNAALVQQREELVWLAKRDALTGLFNRGEFLRLAEAELLRAKRHETDTSAIMVDLDFFKSINDLHGHPAGDKVLKHAAALLLAGVRATDTVARVGGEEFIVLLPETSQHAAMALAEKLLRTLRQTPAPVASDLELSVTASMGVGTVSAGHEGSVATLYAAADHALYEAKRGGRDRVERTEPDPSLTPSDFQRLRRG